MSNTSYVFLGAYIEVKEETDETKVPIWDFIQETHTELFKGLSFLTPITKEEKGVHYLYCYEDKSLFTLLHQDEMRLAEMEDDVFELNPDVISSLKTLMEDLYIDPILFLQGVEGIKSVKTKFGLIYTSEF